MNDEHKKKISESMKGRKPSKAAMDALKKRFEESHHNRALWILIDPNGKLHRVDYMLKFCEENGISYSSLRMKAKVGDMTPVKSGKSKGWCVFAMKKLVTQIS